MTANVNYFIQIKDHINKSTRIINKITNLDTYNNDFNTIVEYLNKDDLFSVSTSNGEATLSKAETQIIPGYIYNSSKIVNTLAYTLSLIKIDNQLSSVFPTNYTDRETQTNEQADTKNIQTQEDEQKQETENKSSQTTEENDSPSLEEYENEFGEFQGYMPPNYMPPEFTDVDLNTTTTYPYCNNVITPPYTAYNPYTYNTFNSYTNPFNTVMSLRGENEDVHFTFGSQVPRNPTSSSAVSPVSPVSPVWGPELISELKFRLSQPNAGLTQNNSTYFL
jgi:hypothetical protein